MNIKRPMNSKKMTKKIEKYQKKINNAQKDILKINEHFNKSKAEQKKYLYKLRNIFKRGYYSPTTLKFYQNKLSKYHNKLQELTQSHSGGRRRKY
jgi:preprotein translocase subunit SecA